MPGPADSRDALEALLARRLVDSARTWLDGATSEIRRDSRAIERLFPAAGRRVGRGPLLDPIPPDPVRLIPGRGPILNAWTLADAARARLLLEDALRDPDGVAGRANDLYFLSSGVERLGVLRALSCLSADAEAVPAVRDALRANAADLFEAAIAENLYASKHLPDDAFFQAVLKCLFMGIRIDRIERLEERATPELARMLFSFVTEREHAGRAIPVEVWPILALNPPEGLDPRVRKRLDAARDEYERAVLGLALERLLDRRESS